MAGLTFAIAGAGNRGRMFAEIIHATVGPHAVTAVADPHPDRRKKVAELFDLPEDRCFGSYKELIGGGKLADGLVNATMDLDHHDCALSALRKGYHLFQEKPVATTVQDAAEIEAAALQSGKVVAVCHSLRYHAVGSELHRLVKSGVIGDVVSIDQVESVEHVHMSHSFVRGNWGVEAKSTNMLLAKSCHDIDLIAFYVGKSCRRVSSFGTLTYFRPESAPKGAPARCTDGCPHEAACPYSSLKVYGEGKFWAGATDMAGMSPSDARERLKTSPYGRCVFHCDNDVVDHQVVAMEFEGGATGTFTMTAFTPWGGRYIRIHGTLGYIEAKLDQRVIEVYEFWRENKKSTIELPESGGAHGGGDSLAFAQFVRAVQSSDPSAVPTSASESARTFLWVEAAERSRKQGRTVDLAEVEAEATRFRSAFRL